MANAALRFLEGLPPAPLYMAITVFSAIENVFPPIPADTAVALGAFLAGRGRMNVWLVFGLTWGGNALTAAGVYFLARTSGPGVFAGRLGRRLLSEQTLARIAQAYGRYGSVGIFLSRLLPVWRAVVGPFAGLVGLSASRALIPIVLASGLYYGFLTFLVYTLGGNLERVLAALGQVNGVLVGLAVTAAALVAYQAWRARRTS